MHPEKGTFKVNTQRLKPYFGGDFHTNKQHIQLSISGVGSQGVMQSREPGNIEIQGSRANDIKQSATWEATQDF